MREKIGSFFSASQCIYSDLTRKSHLLTSFSLNRHLKVSFTAIANRLKVKFTLPIVQSKESKNYCKET